MAPVTNENPDLQASRIVILGGGPGGYEAALVARRLGADVTVVERQGLGGAAVLTDVVPSKTLIATADWMTIADRAADLGIRLPVDTAKAAHPAMRRHMVDLDAVNTRVMALAAAQSADIHARLEREGVRVLIGEGRLDGPSRVHVTLQEDAAEVTVDADVILLALGATPRVLPTAIPDGERILTWTQLYNLKELPERLIVVGSGVTGAEFAGAYNALGSDVVLVSSRDRVLPGEDADAAELIEGVFRSRGMTVMSRTRAEAAVRTDEGVEVTLADGRVVKGSHVLLAVGSIPSTAGIGLEEAGVRLTASGHVQVDKVSRTSVRGIYAAGDCTGILPLASVAAMQGRVAMSHALGDAVSPIKLRTVAANIFTAPEIATVGYSEEKLKEQGSKYVTTTLPLARNPRAKMLGMRDGFVKLFAHPEASVVLGGVVVAPRASELIFPITLAVAHRLTVDDVAEAFTVYPSLSGSIAEVARMLHHRED
ncbi:NAD(P)H-quinone dehydrogenase [Oerskovia turbata]|uniref:NAD(P)H dehydrogenase (quinone) n=1 Tax=Oerskovia turbata TaxID=1713 RepID=A0A4Q1L1W3_9CELL|nr:NAD(P)H-quinone dehydrogenase [Oerskovia turbata]RXR26278.1 NAD(P)H-quinone dehydrogenase [Oerskovia turbata]RXR36780.1 NAD(P)H-quinone dehydrogenase [Oerskovia turbata]TGJ97469.1 NAD(P)H-quinone dehydrogenase [Actinotalea fermentans ATCC 43279 = JCM 9966 = DSM 3133]